MCKNKELCWHCEVIMKLSQLHIVQIHQNPDTLLEQSVILL